MRHPFLSLVTGRYLLCPVLLQVATSVASAAYGQGFYPAVPYSTGINSQPREVALGDINGDGLLDIVSAGAGAGGGAGVLLGQATGGFGAVVSYLVNTAPGTYGLERVAVGDVNNDGRLDLVTTNLVVNANFSPIGVLLGQAGGFAPVTVYPSNGNYLRTLALGDLNNDGRLDIVGINEYSGDASVLMGQASGTFGPTVKYSFGFGFRPSTLALGDLNNDGRLDVVAASAVSGGLRVLLGQAGGFGPAIAYAAGRTGLHGVALGDLNNDGQLDVVVADALNYSIAVFSGLPGGGLGALVTYALGAGIYPLDVALGDVNGDAVLDIVAVNNGPVYSTASVLVGQLGGGFGLPVHYAVPGTSTNPRYLTVALGDTNNDGRLDIVTADSDMNEASVLLATPVSSPAPLRLGGGIWAVGSTVAVSGTNLLGATSIRFAGPGNPSVSSGFTVSADGTCITGIVVPMSAQTGLVSVVTPRGTISSTSPFVIIPLTTTAALQPESVGLFPNPAHGTATIQLPAIPGAPTAPLTLLDALGRTLRTQTVSTNARAELDLTGLAPGLYAVRVQAGAATAMRRLVVE